MMGNRAIYHDGWVACTTPPVPPWSPSGAEADVILNSARRQGLQEFARFLPNMSTQIVVAEMQGVLTRSGLMSSGRDSDREPG